MSNDEALKEGDVAASSCDVDFHFCHTFLHEFYVRSLMRTEGGHKYVLSAMWT